MAKESGLGAEFIVDGVRFSGDIGALGAIQGGNSPLVVTGINALGFQRIGGVRNGLMNLTAWFNPSPAQAHKVLSTLPTADRLKTYLHRPAFGRPAANLVSKQTNYDGTRAQDGAFSFDVSALSNAWGLEWTEQLTNGMQVFGAAGPGTGLDYTALVGTTLFGLQAYMQVTAFTGTSATVAVQHSNDNGVGDPWANIPAGGFTAVNAIGSQRIQTARTESIKRWLRINVTGVFSNLEVCVMVCKNVVSTVF